MNISIDELSESIEKELFEYSEEVDKNLQDCIDSVSQKIVQRLENNPIIPEKSGKYKEGFFFKTVAKGKGFKRNIVANKRSQLTHLLEHGHAIKGGTKRTRKFPHWKEAEKEAERLIMEEFNDGNN